MSESRRLPMETARHSEQSRGATTTPERERFIAAEEREDMCPVRLPRRLLDRLRIYAATTRQKQKVIVQQALEQYLDAHDA